MAPEIHGLRKKLSYPLYAADFDPLNQDFLLVGGGGGSTPSGVPNKIVRLALESFQRTSLTFPDPHRYVSPHRTCRNRRDRASKR